MSSNFAPVFRSSVISFDRAVAIQWSALNAMTIHIAMHLVLRSTHHRDYMKYFYNYGCMCVSVYSLNYYDVSGYIQHRMFVWSCVTICSLHIVFSLSFFCSPLSNISLSGRTISSSFSFFVSMFLFRFS